MDKAFIEGFVKTCVDQGVYTPAHIKELLKLAKPSDSVSNKLPSPKPPPKMDPTKPNPSTKINKVPTPSMPTYVFGSGGGSPTTNQNPWVPIGEPIVGPLSGSSNRNALGFLGASPTSSNYR